MLAPLVVEPAGDDLVPVLLSPAAAPVNNYAELRIIILMRTALLCGPAGGLPCRPHGLPPHPVRITAGARSEAMSRSGGRNLPGLSWGSLIAPRASSFSVGSAWR